jgi:hypothetical protein
MILAEDPALLKGDGRGSSGGKRGRERGEMERGRGRWLRVP